MFIISIWFVWTQLAAIKWTLLIAIMVADALFFLITPIAWLPFVANGFCYALLMIWIIVVKKMWDITIISWSTLMSVDILLDRVHPTQPMSWVWRCFSAHSISFGIIVLILVYLFISTHPIPEAHSFLLTWLAVLLRSIRLLTRHFTFTGFLALLVWLPVWTLDYCIDRPIEWLIVPFLSVVKVASHWKSPRVLILFLLGFGCVEGVAYMVTPTHYVPLVANTLLHTLILGILFRVQSSSTVHHAGNYVKSSYSVIFICLLYTDRYARAPPFDAWVFLGNLSIGCSLVLLLPIILDTTVNEDTHQ
jgi:hypothetical protein